MDKKLLLIKCIVLLYLQRKLEKITDVDTMIVTALETIVPSQIKIDGDITMGHIEGLRTVVIWLLEDVKHETVTTEEILQRTRLATEGSESLTQTLKLTLDVSIEDERKVNQIFRQAYSDLYNYITTINLEAELRTTLRSLSGVTPSDVNIKRTELIEKLSNMVVDSGGMARPTAGLLSEASTDDSSLDDIVENTSRLRGPEYILRSGYQWFNEMSGTHGFLRGGLYLPSARTHNGKSLFAQLFAFSIPLFNKHQVCLDPTKKPCVCIASTEDDIYKYIRTPYRAYYEMVTGAPYPEPIYEGTDEEIARSKAKDNALMLETVKGIFTSNGWTLRICKLDPSQADLSTLYNWTDNIRDEGYEICFFVVDYLYMMVNEAPGANKAALTQWYFNRVKVKYANELTTMYLPHQTNTKLEDLVRDGNTAIAKEAAGKGYYEFCQGLGREADFEIVFAKVKPGDGFVYFEAAMGKNKLAENVPPEKAQYAARRCEAIGLMPYDADGPCLTLNKIGGSTVAEGGGDSFW